VKFRIEVGRRDDDACDWSANLVSDGARDRTAILGKETAGNQPNHKHGVEDCYLLEHNVDPLSLKLENINFQIWSMLVHLKEKCKDTPVSIGLGLLAGTYKWGPWLRAANGELTKEH